MIVNHSRYSLQTCWRRIFNQFHRRLEGPRSMNLVDGGAMHEGIAVGLAEKDWAHAIEAARAKFDEDTKTATIPPEQTYLIEEHWQLVLKMIAKYQANWEQEGYEIIQPECTFDVELPGSMHNCIMMHWRDVNGNEYWGEPPAEQILARCVRPAHVALDSHCKCYTPHRLVGKTDAVVAWQRLLWLLEHKTNSLAPETFWKPWDIDIQPTIYIYGIWRSLGIRPRGVVVNAIHKPSEAQVSNWNSKRKYGPPKSIADYIDYERRPFLRSEEDLLRVERTLTDFCNEWEWRVVTGQFNSVMLKTVCFSYNRHCDFYGMCTQHDEPGALSAMNDRAPDYVDDKMLVQILPGLAIPSDCDYCNEPPIGSAVTMWREHAACVHCYRKLVAGVQLKPLGEQT